MIVDKNGKLFGKFSIVDAAVILVLIVFVIGLSVRLMSSTSSLVKETTSFEYVVKVENVRECSIDAIKKMGKLTDKKSEKEIGEIIDVEVMPSQFESITASGEVVMTELPEKYSCLVTIRSTGKESSESYFTADNTELSVGRTFDIFSKYIKTSGIIQSIEVLK